METNNKRKALGKGLEQLFNSEQLNFETFEQEIVEPTLFENLLRRQKMMPAVPYLRHKIHGIGKADVVCRQKRSAPYLLFRRLTFVQLFWAKP